MTRKWYATLRHPKMYPHTKFGIPTSKNIGDMDRTQKRDGRTDGRTVRLLYASQSSFGGIKMKELEWSQDFPHYNPMGAICCHGNQSSDPILPKTLCSQSPTLMMLLMKFYDDWPSGFRDIHVRKCGRTHGRMDRRTDAGLIPIL